MFRTLIAVNYKAVTGGALHRDNRKVYIGCTEHMTDLQAAQEMRVTSGHKAIANALKADLEDI
ncbi:MAG: hypothetical protein FRX49_01655 [Trebouxia sp. A1-2]|nr:MAG: hypothetical protein FRX49_01655 [Trebouxia sp. A1-2]